jgi:hypothetical protein
LEKHRLIFEVLPLAVDQLLLYVAAGPADGCPLFFLLPHYHSVHVQHRPRLIVGSDGVEGSEGVEVDQHGWHAGLVVDPAVFGLHLGALPLLAPVADQARHWRVHVVVVVFGDGSNTKG